MYTLQRALEDSAKLIRRFSTDEEVAYDFTEENYLAKTRERDTDYPQVLVAPDRIWRASPDAMRAHLDSESQCLDSETQTLRP